MKVMMYIRTYSHIIIITENSVDYIGDREVMTYQQVVRFRRLFVPWHKENICTVLQRDWRVNSHTLTG